MAEWLNGRANELAAKAGFYVDEEGKVWPKYPDCDISEEFKAFATLIIDECAAQAAIAGEIIFDTINERRMVDPRTFPHNLIIEHFYDWNDDEEKL